MPELRHTTVAGAAESLAVTPDKITDLIHSGQLPAVNVALRTGGKARWRIPIEDLVQFLARRRTQPKTIRAPRRKRTAAFQRKYFR